MKRIILASTSPRRRELMKKLGLPFRAVGTPYEEDMTQKLSPAKLVRRLALGKAEAVARTYPDAFIIAADSIVVFKKHVYGKPKTDREARKMLALFQGSANDILTGVAIIDTATGRTATFVEKTAAYFAKMTPADIRWYVGTGEPLTRAGAYAVQDIGAQFITRIEGDLSNAIGFPLPRVRAELKKFGLKFP